jgi:glycyl-tRNA synthetase beta subunit
VAAENYAIAEGLRCTRCNSCKICPVIDAEHELEKEGKRNSKKPILPSKRNILMFMEKIAHLRKNAENSLESGNDNVTESLSENFSAEAPQARANAVYSKIHEEAESQRQQRIRDFQTSSQTKNKVMNFLLERIKSSLKDEFDSRAVDALSKQLIEEPIPSVIHFIELIDQRIKDPKLMEALNPYRRARNLTAHMTAQTNFQASLLEAAAEKNLHETILAKKINLTNLVVERKYSAVLDELESLAQPLANFFENVMVNDNNLQIKENRLALLFQVRKLYEDIADFSVLQV